jgi:hypothetical protein
MRVVTRTKKTISKEDFTEFLGVKVTKLEFEDSYFKAVIKQNGQETSVYLRCADIRGMCDIPYNMLDAGITPVKRKPDTFVYFAEEEHVKQSFNLKKLKAKLQELTQG